MKLSSMKPKESESCTVKSQRKVSVSNTSVKTSCSKYTLFCWIYISLKQKGPTNTFSESYHW